jgi:hypothetical protein
MKPVFVLNMMLMKIVEVLLTEIHRVKCEFIDRNFNLTLSGGPCV